MAEKIFKAGVKRQTGWLYYIDKGGDIARAKMARGGSGGKGRPEVLVRSGVKREPGYLYFIDKSGDVARVKMARGGGRKRKAKGTTARRATAKRTTARRATKKAKKRR